MGKGGAPAGDQKISVLLGDDALIGNAIEPGGFQSGAVSPAVGIGGVIGPGVETYVAGCASGAASSAETPCGTGSLVECITEAFSELGVTSGVGGAANSLEAEEAT